MQARWNNLPIRLRLTFLYAGLLVILLVGLGAFLYFDTRDFLISTTSLRLQALANTSITRLAVPALPEPRSPLNPRDPVPPASNSNNQPLDVIAKNLARELSWQDTTAVVMDKTGARVADGRELTGQNTPTPDPKIFARALNGESSTYTTADLIVVLIPIRSSRPNAPIAGILQMSTSLDLVDRILERQRVLIGLGVTIALVIALLGGTWLTHTTLTPLHLMVDTCRRIAAGDLSQRVNLPHRQDEPGQLAAAFDEMVAQLENTFTQQRQFVADASHELRTPLTAISGSLDVLLLAPEGDPESMRRVLHGMRREMQRLTRLVSDLLTLTRLDAHRRLNLQCVDLALLGNQVIEEIRPLAQNRAMKLQALGDSNCMGDADQLKQVFYNLLGNAIQATDADRGEIILRVDGFGNAVGVAVTDNGAGIPAQAQSRIFERFYRVDKARARASGGSGLGLAIVKSIVEGHGGSIEPIQSEPGHGTTIQFTLARSPSRAK
jgi:two-component system, OmpR family, sensor kinase